MRELINAIFILLTLPFVLMFTLPMTFLLNLLSIPALLISLPVCKLFHLKMPRIRLYGWMIYPQWKDAPRKSLILDMIESAKETTAPKKPKSVRNEELEAEWRNKVFNEIILYDIFLR